MTVQEKSTPFLTFFLMKSPRLSIQYAKKDIIVHFSTCNRQYISHQGIMNIHEFPTFS